MGLDQRVTDLAGLLIIVLGLVSLTESLLQVQIVGKGMPLMQGTFVSLFAVSFGGVLLTKGASKAFEKFRAACTDKILG